MFGYGPSDLLSYVWLHDLVIYYLIMFDYIGYIVCLVNLIPVLEGRQEGVYS